MNHQIFFAHQKPGERTGITRKLQRASNRVCAWLSLRPRLFEEAPHGCEQQVRAKPYAIVRVDVFKLNQTLSPTNQEDGRDWQHVVLLPGSFFYVHARRFQLYQSGFV